MSSNMLVGFQLAEEGQYGRIHRRDKMGGGGGKPPQIKPLIL